MGVLPVARIRGQFGQQFGGGGGVQADLHPGQFHLAGQGQALLFVLVDEVGACVLAGVAQLHAGHRPVALDGVGQKGPAGQIAGVLRSRWNMWEASVAGWTTSSLAVTAAAPPLARSS